MLVLEEPLSVRAPHVRQVIEAGKQPGQVPADGDVAVLVPFGAFDHHHRAFGVNVVAAQAAGFGRSQSRAEDQPEDDRDRILAERAAVLGGEGVGRPEERGQLLIGEHVRQAAFFRAADSFDAEYRSPFREYTIPVIFRLILGAGLRPTEARRLRRHDVDAEGAMVMIERSKRNKDRHVPADGDVAVLVPFGAFDHHHRAFGVNVVAAQAAGFGRSQSRAEDQPEDDRDRILAERAAVLGVEGGGRPQARGGLGSDGRGRQAAFVRAADSFGAEYRSPFREYTIPVIFRLILGAGLRPPEARRLRRHDVDAEGAMVMIERSKRNKDRHVPVSGDLAGLLARFDHLADMRRADREWFFEDQHGCQYSPSWLIASYHRCCERAGGIAPASTPYTLRHNYATRTLM